jgi:hypothetical protein
VPRFLILARRWQIADDGPLAYNEPGKAPRAATREEKVSGGASRLRAGPWSVTLYALNAE